MLISGRVAQLLQASDVGLEIESNGIVELTRKTQAVLKTLQSDGL